MVEEDLDEQLDGIPSLESFADARLGLKAQAQSEFEVPDELLQALREGSLTQCAGFAPPPFVPIKKTIYHRPPMDMLPSTDELVCSCSLERGGSDALRTGGSHRADLPAPAPPPSARQ